MKKSITLACAFLFLFFQMPLQAQHGVAPEWSADVELPVPAASNSVRGFLYSNIGVFSNGKRVVFMDRQDGPGGVYYTYSYNGTDWSEPEYFTPQDFTIGSNNFKIITDDLDRLHIIWASHLPKGLYYAQMDSALNLVIDSVRIADNPNFGSFNDMYITTDLKHRIHVMWNEGKTGEDIPEAFYAQSTDGGQSWSEKVMLSEDDGLPSSFPRGQFNAWAGDTLAILWRDSSAQPSPIENWDLQMVLSLDGGQTWSVPVTINPSLDMQGDPDLVIDPEGRFHLFYHGAPVQDPYWGMRIHYGYSDDLGQSWQPSPVFDNILSQEQRSYLVEGSRYDLQTGTLWTFWKEEDIVGLKGGDMMASYSTDRGLSWSTPEYVTDRGETSIGYKAVSLLPDGGLAINYELPNYPDEGLLRVFYKERPPVTVASRETPIDTQLSIYPNPASDFVTVSGVGLELRSLTLFDLNGKQLFTTKIPEGQQGYAIDVQHLPKGIYFLRIETESGFFNRKILTL